MACVSDDIDTAGVVIRYNEFEKTIVDKLKSSDDKEYKKACVIILTTVKNIVYGGTYVETLCDLSNKYLSTNDTCKWKYVFTDEYNNRVVYINCLPHDDGYKLYHDETTCPYCNRPVEYVENK